jgi:segregation and condensation protein B
LETDEARTVKRGLRRISSSAGGGDAGHSAAIDPDSGWLDEKLYAVLESLLLAAGEPVSLAQLANALEEVPRERIRRALSAMAAAYASGGRGFLLEEIAGGYQLRTPSEHAVYVRRLLSARPPRLSRPVLETLAIVAYRQPVTRPELEQLRGVDSGGVLDTLVERNLIRIAGRKEAPGRPIMYTTTPDFLELFGLKDLESLPDLEEFRELEGSPGVADLVHVGSAASEAPPEFPNELESGEASGLAEPADASSFDLADETIAHSNTIDIVPEDTKLPSEEDTGSTPVGDSGPGKSN